MPLAINQIEEDELMLKLKKWMKAMMVLSCTLSSLNAMASGGSKIHVLDNLNPDEFKVAQKWIEKKGYRISREPLFNEAKDALVITKALPTEFEPASIQIEILRHEGNHSVPHPIFQIKLETQDLVEVLEKIPASGKLSSIPVAFQSPRIQQ